MSADVGNPIVRQLGRYLADRGLTPSPDAKAKGGRGQQASRGHRPRWPSRQNESRSSHEQPSAIRLRCEGFSLVFFSCKANARVFDAKSEHGPHSFPRHCGFTYAPVKRRITPVCDRVSLGSERRQSTNQSLSLPYIVQGNVGPSLWYN